MRRAALACACALAAAGCTVDPARQPAPPSGAGATADADTVAPPAAMALRNTPAVRASLMQRMRQYRSVRRARLRGWIGDSVLISTRFGQTEQLHQVREPLGAREQLTFFREPVAEAAVRPGHPRGDLVYGRDLGGSEFYQLFYLDRAAASSRQLSDGRSRYSEVVWSNAGDRIAYTSTERNGRNNDLYVQDLDGRVARVLTTDDGTWWVTDWSEDDNRLLVIKYLAIDDSHGYQLDLADGSLTPIIDDGLDNALLHAAYGPGDRSVYFTADVGAEFQRLHRLDLATGTIDVLTADIPWDVEEFVISGTGSHLAFVSNENGRSRLSVWHLPAHTPVALPDLPVGVISDLRFAPRGRELGFTLNAARSPGDVFSIDLEQRVLKRWTRSEVGGLDPDTFRAPRLVEYPTFDAVDGAPRMIPAYVYRPRGAGPHPVLVYIHGGPESQYRPWFSTTFQYFVNEMGLAVIAPNVRGSAGYGKSYLALDNGRLREDSVRDIGALLDWIEQQPHLDADRVALYGGSYGGYMVLASLVHYSDRLAAGVESVGISNFVTFLTNTQDYRRDRRRREYGDERDPEMRAFLESISPLNNVHRIRRPLLISQGYNDPRVPPTESGQIAAALEGAGVPVWYVLAMDEGHGFRKRANSDYAAALTAMFLERYLLDAP